MGSSSTLYGTLLVVINHSVNDLSHQETHQPVLPGSLFLVLFGQQWGSIAQSNKIHQNFKTQYLWVSLWFLSFHCTSTLPVGSRCSYCHVVHVGCWKLAFGKVFLKPQTSLWSPACGCAEVAISRLEWEGLSAHSSKCDDRLDTWVIIDPFWPFSCRVCLAWCPKRVTSTWDNIYTTISCLAGLLWM